MKIAIYSGAIPSTSFIENLIQGLAQRNYQILLFGKKKGSIQYDSNVSTHFFPASVPALFLKLLVNGLLLMVKRPSAFAKIIKNVRKYGTGLPGKLYAACSYLMVVNNLPDVFHIQWIKSGDEWLFLQGFSVKVVASFRGAHVNYSPIADAGLAQLYRETFDQYDGFHSVSEALSQEAQKYGAAPDKIFRIPGAVQPALLEQTKVERSKSAMQDELRLLSVGREHWKKGYHYALDTCALLKERGINFKYTIIGVGVSEELLFQVHDLNIQHQVVFIERVEHAEVFDFYKEADLLLLPSVEEGIANVVLEAMALGLPVVSTNCGGMTEVIEHEKNGWLVPVRDPVAMADVICDIREGRYNISSINKAARETIREKHLIPGQLDAFERMYRSLM